MKFLMGMCNQKGRQKGKLGAKEGSRNRDERGEQKERRRKIISWNCDRCGKWKD
jgi:hypothetical protein